MQWKRQVVGGFGTPGKDLPSAACHLVTPIVTTDIACADLGYWISLLVFVYLLHSEIFRKLDRVQNKQLKIKITKSIDLKTGPGCAKCGSQHSSSSSGVTSQSWLEVQSLGLGPHLLVRT